VTHGHLIVGAGKPGALGSDDKYAFDDNGKSIKTFTLLQHGGVQARISVTNLANDQMATPYENMLPWVALTFCKKKQEVTG
jgi:hypothetical protein